MREFSWIAILLGVVIGALLAAANTFVGLKIGMTISASIPAAVLSLLVLRTLLKRGSLLESNMVQTVGSAGESLAAGMIFTIPALFIMHQDPAYLEMVIWGGIGGLLGVCFMIPLRQVLIVKEHGVLPYPEGVACAEVLESGERGSSGAKSVIWGALVGGVYYLFNGLGFFSETGRIAIRRFRTESQLDSSPALLGVGYILGVRVGGYMLAGALMAWFVLIPAIGFFGAAVEQPVYPETAKTIAEMSPDDIWNGYIRYIGAGAVAIGGLISLFKSFPTILASMWHILGGVFKLGKNTRSRTDKDFPFSLLILIVGGLGYAMWSLEAVKLDHLGVVAVIVFSFFFVTVSSRLVGIVGSSSNPVSGMTIATILGTALVYRFFVMDQAGDPAEVDLTSLKVTCLSVGAIVCVAISVAGDTSQDLKTGFLLKATPYKQQMGEMIGVITAVVAVAGVILLLNNAYGFTPDRSHPLPAYQANIIKIIVEGVLGGQVPWTLLMMGGAAAVVVELLGLSALPFAVGMYLPLGLSTPIMIGGLIRWLIDRKRKESAEHDPGTLTAAGLVAGKGLMGVVLAGVTVLIAWLWNNPQWVDPATGREEAVDCSQLVPWVWSKIDALPVHWGLPDGWWDALPMFPFAVLVVWLWRCAGKRLPIQLPPVEPVLTGPPQPVTPTPIEQPELSDSPPDNTGEPNGAAHQSDEMAEQAERPAGADNGQEVFGEQDQVASDEPPAPDQEEEPQDGGYPPPDPAEGDKPDSDDDLR